MQCDKNDYRGILAGLEGVSVAVAAGLAGVVIPSLEVRRSQRADGVIPSGRTSE
jgi:hypothetical protein